MERNCLRREPADSFQTRRVILGQTDNGCGISPFGDLISFDQLQAFRQAGVIGNHKGSQVFANLGVSLQLIIHHQDRKALALVPQGNILKLVSGYVPDSQLATPLETAWAELMEEVLPWDNNSCHGYSWRGQAIDDPYSSSGMMRLKSLEVREAPFLGGQRPVNLLCSGRPLGWPVSFYIHQQTASLQLVFPMAVTLPDSISLIHVEDRLDNSSQQVLSIIEPDSPVILMELGENYLPTGELFTLKHGQWVLWTQGEDRFSEFFTGPGKKLLTAFEQP